MDELTTKQKIKSFELQIVEHEVAIKHLKKRIEQIIDSCEHNYKLLYPGITIAEHIFECTKCGASKIV